MPLRRGGGGESRELELEGGIGADGPLHARATASHSAAGPPPPSSVSVIASFAAKAAYNMVANERHTQHTGARADGPSRPDPHSEMLTHDSLAILTQLLEELLPGFD